MKNLLLSLRNNIPRSSALWFALAVGMSLLAGIVIGIGLYRPVTTTFTSTASIAADAAISRERIFDAAADYVVPAVTSGAQAVLVSELDTSPDTGELVMNDVYNRSGDTMRLSASLIKLATLVAYQKTIGVSASDTAVVTPAEDAVEGASFKSGDTVSSYQLGQALLIASSNQSANTMGRLALSHGVDVIDTARRLYPHIVMNSFSGLDTSSSLTPRDAITLSYDLFHLDPTLASTSTNNSVVLGSNAASPNTNVSLRYTPEVYFSKTGFTTPAGGNLVVLARVCDKNFGIAVMGDTFDGRFASVRSYVESLRSACDLSRVIATQLASTNVIQ